MKLAGALSLICSLLFLFAKEQAIDSSYLLYPTQYESISQMRGMPAYEIKELLERYKQNKIESDADFARLLSHYYSSNKGIAVILYFYNNSILKRTLFEPGKLIETKEFSITVEELFALSTRLNSALNVYKLTSNRSPVLRGIPPMPRDTTTYNLTNIIDTLTTILLPASFSKTYQHLIVIPCLNIGTIPFYLLKPYADSTYLIDHCSLEVAPTLLDFVFLRSKILQGKTIQQVLPYPDSLAFTLDNPLFVSNPEYPANTDYYFPDLPGAEKEIDSAIASSHHYKLFKGRDAKKDSILKYLTGADLAYFATHGVADATDPVNKSFLVLSGEEPYLTSKEIQNLRLKKDFHAPEMVILSACQTGLGKSMDGGIAGSLARSFILSGSNYIIESLWNVDDMATAFLMNRFMFYIQQKTAFFPSGALRLAVLDTKQKFPSPLYWASFSAFGTSW